jgi:Uma2 family endonuclease
MSAAISLLDLVPVMTAEQFANWPGDGTGRAFQLIDGEPVAMAPPSQIHGLLQTRLARRLDEHLERTGSGCLVITGPGIQPRFNAATNVRIPDLAITCSSVADHYMADPVVIVEILSPSNHRETYEAIRAYLSLPSLREVIVVSSVRVAAETFRRGPDDAWPADPTPVAASEDLVVATFGFRWPLKTLYPPEMA